MNAKSKLPSIQRMTGREESLFTPGALLQADDLTGIGEYLKARERLMFRTLFGCGVMCGLVVHPHEDECKKLHIVVDCGVALDCCGDPVEVPKAEELIVDCGITDTKTFWVVMRRIEKGCAPRTAVCAEEDDEAPSVCTRLREGYEISLLDTKPECACGCEPLSPTPTTAAAAAKVQSEPKRTVWGKSRYLAGADPCLCANPRLDCYKKHYAGECCGTCGQDCDCDWIVLAQVQNNSPDSEDTGWIADHSYRRFVRPVLMRDPQVALESGAESLKNGESAGANSGPST